MHISIEAVTADIEPAFHWIGGLIGAALDKRVAGFEQQERNNPLLANHFRENFALEFSLARRGGTAKAPGACRKAMNTAISMASSSRLIGYTLRYRLRHERPSKADCVMRSTVPTALDRSRMRSALLLI
jgi:hypothetical protein